MNRLVVTSALFGCIGMYIISQNTQNVTGYGMCIVSFTSLLYHTTYHPVLRVVDYTSNVTLGLFFLCQPTYFGYWFVRLCWSVLAMVGNLNTLNISTPDHPHTHFWFVHLPVLLGFCCIALEYTI